MSEASSTFITDRYPELGKGPVPVAPYIDPAYYEREKELIFKKTTVFRFFSPDAMAGEGVR